MEYAPVPQSNSPYPDNAQFLFPDHKSKVAFIKYLI
jgi:hypothetical protein